MWLWLWTLTWNLIGPFQLVYWLTMKICIICHFFQDFNFFLFHPKTRVAWGPHLSFLPEVEVLQDEHVIWDLKRLSISVTRSYVTKCTAHWQNSSPSAKLLGVMAPSITSMGLCHPNPPPRQMLHTELWCCIQHFWVVHRFTCISELIFVTTKLPATLLAPLQCMWQNVGEPGNDAIELLLLNNPWHSDDLAYVCWCYHMPTSSDTAWQFLGTGLHLLAF